MRPHITTTARAALLAGPVALAFFAGGYNDGPRLVALCAAAVVLGLLALSAERPVPRRAQAWTALGGLAGLCAWMAISRSWAPLDDPAGDDVERVLLYVLAFTAGIAAWRSREAVRVAEPLVALGTLIVTGYGLAGRLAPGIVVQHPSISAGGRLEQPLTYWNASGALAALGVVLCARIAGDRQRQPWLRAAAAAAAVPLCAGVYLSFSRGALVALAGGILVLLVLAPTWSQLRAAAICLEAGAIGSLATAVPGSVRGLQGSLHTREWQGAVVLVVLLGAMALAAMVALWSVRVERERSARLGRLPLPSWAPVAAVALSVALVVIPVVAAHRETSPSFGATNSRLASTSSNRYEYWRVALSAFAHHPVKGLGTSGFGPEWLRRRHIDERVHDAHSLELETLAELGLPGFALLLALLGGVVAAGRRVWRGDPAVAAGPAAALAVWLLHASVDWDWEMPALTLIAVSLAAMLVALADHR